MKKIIPDPLDNYYNYCAITRLFTELSEENQDVVSSALNTINEYIDTVKRDGSLGAIKAIGLSMRLSTDSLFQRQMIEATMQHNPAAFVFTDDKFFYEYFLPRLKELASMDFLDTREYRFHLLKTFSFEKLKNDLEEHFSGIEITLTQEMIENAIERLNVMVQYFKENGVV